MPCHRLFLWGAWCVALLASLACRVERDGRVADGGIANAASADAGTHDAGAGDGGPRDAGPSDGGGGGDQLPDPFTPQPDTGEGLTNVSADLDAVLERGALLGACDAWLADTGDRRKKLLCGKAMFFDEGFGTIGVPDGLLEFFGNRFPDISGTAWSGFGLVPDPRTGDTMPLGVGPGAPLGSVPTSAYTCAACHFARLPDGRYAVGAPNHAYAYGRQFLAISIPPASVAPGFDPSTHHPDAIAAVQPFLDALAADVGLRISLLFDLLPLIGAAQPSFSVESEAHYAHWPNGAMDFLIEPLPLDDGAHTVSKILSLWGLATPDETAQAGMASEQLAWTGGARSLMDFLDGFVAIGDGSGAWSEDRLSPLAEYVLSLRAPANPSPPPADAVARGRALFDSVGCVACHDGPRGMGRALYPFDEIGTDDAMRAWGDPELDGAFCCDFAGAPTHRIKSPRLVGLWAQQRFLHNGALSSLEELLCLEERAASGHDAQGSAGHTYGCELTVAERRDLIALLRSL